MKHLITLLFISTYSLVHSQNWELGIMAGASNYKGDLAPNIVFNESHPMIGFFGKKNLSPYFSFRAGFNYGRISGNDANFEHLEKRNLSFSSPISEIQATFEFNFFRFVRGLHPKQFTPYVYSGITAFKFNPTAEYEGKTYDLRELGTEGQVLTDENRYSLYGIGIPIGAGFKFSLGPRWYVAIDASYRATFTDYLDDVGGTYYNTEILAEEQGPIVAALADPSIGDETYSFGQPGKQRGDQFSTDWYIFAGISVSYVFKNAVCFDF